MRVRDILSQLTASSSHADSSVFMPSRSGYHTNLGYPAHRLRLLWCLAKLLGISYICALASSLTVHQSIAIHAFQGYDQSEKDEGKAK